jgi:DNA-binding MarR family transcriptional regulator
MADQIDYGLVGGILEKLIRKYNKSIRHGEHHTLSISELVYLLSIKNDQMITMSALARAVGVSMSTATVMVEKLVKKGLVERIRDDGDRRQVYIRFLDEGERVYKAVQSARQQVAENVMSIFDDKEKLLVYEALIKLYRNLDNL